MHCFPGKENKQETNSDYRSCTQAQPPNAAVQLIWPQEGILIMLSFDSHFRHFAFLCMLKNSASHPTGISKSALPLEHRCTSKQILPKLEIDPSVLQISQQCAELARRDRRAHLLGRRNRCWSPVLTLKQMGVWQTCYTEWSFLSYTPKKGS